MTPDPKCPCRQGPQDFLFGDKPVEPDQALIAGENRHLPVVQWRDIGIRLDCQDGIGLMPIGGCRSPDPCEIEPVAVSERETEAPVAKLRRRHQAAVGWKCPSFRSNDVHSAWTAVARTQPPWQFHHLHIAVMAPYDDAALVERRVGLENLRAHHIKNISGTLL